MTKPHSQRFMRAQLIRLGRLMDMLYKPAEVAEAIGVTADTVYRNYLALGCPFEQDKAGNVWIHGLSFAAWVRDVNAKKRNRGSLEPGQGWCCRCNAVVMMQRPRLKHSGRYTKIYQSKCATCGAKVNRAYAASANVEVAG